MTLRAVVISVLLLGPSIASGDEARLRPIDFPGQAPELGFVGAEREDGLVLARQVLPAQATPPAPHVAGVRDVAAAQSRIIYLNKDGVTLLPGANDSRNNRSSIVTQQTALQGWNVDPATWQETVACMRELFAPFDVTIVDTPPGNVPHIEAVFGGRPEQLGLAPNVAGVSPFTMDCSIIENSIVFTFSNAYAFSAREACEIMAQEVAHSYGLDHELLASDPMTYLPYNGNRTFQDQDATCGESMSAPRQCGINGSVCRPTQNSVQLLAERLGLADAIAPTVAVTSPPNNAIVPPGFQVKVNGSDNIAVIGAVLKINGTLIDEISGPGPYVFSTPASLPEGPHTLVVEISDGKNVQTETRTVTVKIGAPPPPDDEDGGTYVGQEVTGGCSAVGPSAGHSTGALLALALLGLVTRRRGAAA